MPIDQFIAGLWAVFLIGGLQHFHFSRGNLIQDDLYKYEYNLVLEVTKKNNQVQTYRYFQWDDSGKPVGMAVKEKNGSGTWQTKPYYYWTNQRGDVTAIVDSSGAKVGAYTYDAFGNERSETGDIAKSNPIRYAGYYYDTETKHDYLKARYYDPKTGNFLALDPHPGDDDDPVSQNGYTYVGNNPVMEIDPDGNFAFFAAYFVPVIGVYVLGITLIAAGVYVTGYGVWHLTKKAKSILLRAQNNKQIKKKIAGLENQVRRHKEKIRKHSHSRDVKQWKHEVEVWERDIARLKSKLRR
ncbi:RHS repeat-associated core domain-containing protein [Terrilactibacillus sp. S3-3]|nr:RHS repeat-associated core domain-containing protein [Terrilactibacillus sp. S3-3]